MQTLLLFLPELLGTFVGAAMGLAAAMWWDRRKDQRTKDEETLRTLESIYGEIDFIESSMSVYDEPVSAPEIVPKYPSGPQPVKFEFVVGLLPEAAFNSAVHSGRLGLLTPSLQVDLSSFYDICVIGRMNRNHTMAPYALGRDDPMGDAQYAANARTYLFVCVSLLKDMVPGLRKKIETECDELCRRLGQKNWRRPEIGEA